MLWLLVRAPQRVIYLEALKLYDGMRFDFTLVGLLSSCVLVGALNMWFSCMELLPLEGLWILFMLRLLLLICMQNVAIWMVPLVHFMGWGKAKGMFLLEIQMIVGYGVLRVHDRGDGAISFLKANVDGRAPARFYNISRVGVAPRGGCWVHTMVSRYNLKPGIKHYGRQIQFFLFFSHQIWIIIVICTSIECFFFLHLEFHAKRNKDH